MRKGKFIIVGAVAMMVFAGVLMGAGVVEAGLLFEELFDYPKGSLEGQDGGIGFANAWDDATVGDGLSYTDSQGATLPTGDLGHGFISEGQWTFRQTSTTFTSSDSGTYWLTVMMQALDEEGDWAGV